MSSRTRATVRTPRKGLIVAGIAALAVVAALLTPLGASAATIQLSGTVTGPTGGVLASVPVSVVTSSGGLVVATATSSSTGTFVVNGLDQGSYSLKFPATATTYAQYLGGAAALSAATSFDLQAGSGNKANITANLLASATISGLVTTKSGVALSGYSVRAWTGNAQGVWSVAKTVVTAASGAYSLPGLVPGTYRLEAIDLLHPVPLYAPVFSGGAKTVDAATSIGVLGKAVVKYNFALASSGKITGTVTGSTGGEKVAGVRVNVYRLIGTPGAFSSSEPIQSPTATTGAAGTYSIAGLPAGYYTLEFVPPTTPVAPSTTVYGREFLGKIPQAVDATYLQVVDGAAQAGKNIQLGIGGTVHGQILQAEDMPTQVSIDNIKVTIDHAAADPAHPSKDAQTQYTNASLGNNAFSFTGLGPGDYVLIIGDRTTGDTTRKVTVAPLSNGTLSLGNSQLERIPVPLADPAGLHPAAGFEPAILDFSGFTVGSFLVANYGIWSDLIDQSQFTYQWYRGSRLIEGATAQSYSMTSGDWFQTIAVEVGICNFAYGCATYRTADTPAITQGTSTPQSAPSVSGSAVVGQTLTASPGTWSAPGFAFSYLWQVSPDGVSWSNAFDAAGKTHVVNGQDLAGGPYIRASLTGNRYGYFPVSGTTPASSMIQGTIATIKAPVVTATASLFTASAGTWSPALGTTGYTWKVWNTDGFWDTIFGSTLTKAGTAGKYISLTVSRSSNGYATQTTAPITVQTGTAPVATGSTAITGTAKVGATLAAPAYSWLPTVDTETRVWQYLVAGVWTTIAGQTGDTLLVTGNLVGKQLREITTSHKVGYTARVITSPATAAVLAGDGAVNSGAGVSPATPATLTTMTVSPGTFTPTATSVSYQWKQSTNGVTYAAIAGATSASYVVPATLFGRTLAVDITAKRTGHANSVTTVVSGVVTHGVLGLTTAPTVTHVGTVYTAHPGTWSPVPTSVDYAWYVYDDDNVLPGAPASTLSTFDVAATALHRHVALVTTAHATGYSDTTKLVLAKKGDLIASAAPTLAAGTVGTPFSPSTVTWGQNTVALTYQWQYLVGATWTTLAGATSAGYAPTASYLGKQLRVRVTANAPDYNAAVVYSTAALVGAATAPTPGAGGLAPSIAGTVGISATLSATPGTWSGVTAPTFAYKWSSSTDGLTYAPIVGATAATYKIPEAMFGKYLRVGITASKPGYANGQVTVDTAPVSTGALAVVTAPVVTSSAGVYTVGKGAWNVSPTSYAYQWESVDPNTDIASPGLGVGWNTASYKPVAGDGTGQIRVRVTPARANYTATPATVIARVGLALKATTTPFVFGSQAVGSTVISVASDWNSVNPTLKYQWYRAGVAIAGATGATYVRVTADVAKALQLKVTASKPGYASIAYTVAATPTLYAAVPTATTDPTITGLAAVDQTLTATVGVWSPTVTSYTYQWLTQGTPIPGATASTYVARAIDWYADITVVVTAHRVNYADGSATSAPVTIDQGADLSALTAPVIPAIATNGVAIAMTKAPTYAYPVSVTYEWQVQLVGSATWDDIPGANAVSFIPTGYAPGDKLRLYVIAARPGHYNSGTPSSVATLS